MKIKNALSESHVWVGQTIEPGAYYVIPSSELSRWQNDSDVLSDIGVGSLIINNDTLDITDIATAINYLLGTGPKDVKIAYEPPFSAKTIGALKLFTRATGKLFESVASGESNLDFSIPYNACKFNGVEVIGCEVGDSISLKVLDTPAGLLTTVPNYVLNQFGFSIRLPSGFYSRESKYDADLIKDLQIRVVYNNAGVSKNIGVNYMLHELKA